MINMIKNIKNTFILLAFFSIPMVCNAQESKMDWRLFFYFDFEGNSACFYDANGIIHQKDGNVRGWVKCLLQTDLNTVEYTKILTEHNYQNINEKMVNHYLPPYELSSSTATTPSDKVHSMLLLFEEIANVGTITPHLKMLMEFNCSDHMERELSMIFDPRRGIGGSIDKPLEWKFIAPETISANLEKWICLKK